MTSAEKISTVTPLSATKKNGWRTSAQCPICETRKKCGISSDDNVVLCWKVQSPKQANNGAYYHFLTDNRDRMHVKSSSPNTGEPSWSFTATAAPDARPKNEFRQLFLLAYVRSRRQAESLSETAARRCVTIDSLVELGCFHDGTGFVTPERNPEDPMFIVGLAKRFDVPRINDDGSSQRFIFLKGRRGFSFGRRTDDGWQPSHHNACLLVEGGGDAAAADSAGIIGIARSTRAANLKPLAKILSQLSSNTRIYLILENDEPKPGRKTPREEVTEKGRELQEVLGRQIHVVSPPTEHKDVNDWWKEETKGKGHELDDAARFEIGRKMLDHFESQVRAESKPRNVQRAKEIAEDISLSAHLLQVNRRTQGVDADYDISRGCTHQILFERLNMHGQPVLMGTDVACSQWTCLACRKRKVEPEWSIAIVTAFAELPFVFSKWMTEHQFEYMKRQKHSAGRKWVVFKTRDCEPEKNDSESQARGTFFGISSEPLQGIHNQFDFANPEEFEAFASVVRSMICLADAKESRPIANSRNIRKTEKPDVNDWTAKIRKITNEGSVFCGYVCKVVAKSIRSEANRARMVVGCSPFEFISLDSEVNGLSFVISSRNFDCLTTTSANTTAYHALRTFSKWQVKPFASPKWYAKKTKGWINTKIYKGPKQVRKAAEKLKTTVFDIDLHHLSKMTDAASITTSPDKRQEVIDAIAAED